MLTLEESDFLISMSNAGASLIRDANHHVQWKNIMFLLKDQICDSRGSNVHEGRSCKISKNFTPQ